MRSKLFIIGIAVSLMAVAVMAQEPAPPVATEDAMATGAAPEGGMPPFPSLGDMGGEVILEGLTSPQGVFVDADGTLYVVDSGTGGDEAMEMFAPGTSDTVPATYGNTAQIIRVVAGGEPEVLANFTSIAVPEDFVGGGRVIAVDGTVYATVGAWGAAMGEVVSLADQAQVVRVGEDGLEVVADLWATELANNPDETTNLESHPYGIAVGADGLLYVADAAANALLRVDPADGAVETVAVFDPLPGVFPSEFRNNELLTDPVPTGVTFNEAGDLFVSYLSGAPFIPGSAKVVQVRDDGTVTDFATGLTMLTDLTTAPDGNLYAVQYAVFTQEGPQFGSGAIIRILEDGTSEMVMGGLSFPTSVAFNAEGGAYVALNAVPIPGVGGVVYFEGLMDMEGQPLPSMQMGG